MRIAWIGLGRMGVPMAGHASTFAATTGGDVRGFDLSPDARAAAHDAGITVVDNLDDAIDSADVIVLMLPGSPQIEAVLAQATASGRIAPHAIIVDMSSAEPMSSRRLSADFATRGIHLIDAPVSGGVGGAVAASLTIMVGGNEDAITSVEPLLTSMGRVIRTGAIGSGHALKALNNLLSATSLLVSSEALQIGREFGLSDDVMLSVINTSTGRSWSTESKLPNYVVPGRYDSGFAMSLMVKDMRIAMSLADELGQPALLGAESLRLWDRALAELGQQADHTEIGRFAADERN